MKPATVAGFGSISRPQCQQASAAAAQQAIATSEAAEVLDAVGDRDRRRLDDQHVRDREAEETERPDQQSLARPRAPATGVRSTRVAR